MGAFLQNLLVWISQIVSRYERPVFTFHNVGVFNGEISLSPQEFRSYMEKFAELDCETLPLEDYIEQLGMPTNKGRRQMVLTFDAGLLGIYEYAWPVLQEFGFHATIFLSTNQMGKTSDWLTHVPGASQLQLMNWEQAEEMAQDPLICFGTQTCSNSDLTQLSPSRSKEEIMSSKMAIEDRLGQEVQTLSYPFGRYNTRVEQEVRESGLLGACSNDRGVSNCWRNRFRLKRLPFHGKLTEKDLKASFSPLYRLLKG